MDLYENAFPYYPINDEHPHPDVSNRFINVYGEIPCGELSLLDDQLKGFLEVPQDMLGPGEFFVLRARGDSMIGAGISDGDLIIIKKQTYATDSQIVVAYVDGETTLKRFYKNTTTRKIELRPENDNYDTIEVEDCKILGVAVKIIKAL